MKTTITIFTALFQYFCFGQINLEKFEDENRLIGYKDSLGHVIVKPKYYNGSVFHNGLALVSLKNKGWTIIDNTGMELTNFEGIPGPIYNNYITYLYISIKINGKYGFIDRNGNQIIPCIYDDVKDFNEGVAPVKLNGLWGFINDRNEWIISAKYESVTEFYDGLAGFYENKKWGFINIKNEIILKPIYTGITFFSEGLCAVNTSNFNAMNGGITTEVINKMGEVIFTGQFWAFKPYKNGIASYWQGYDFRGKEIFIDKMGNEKK